MNYIMISLSEKYQLIETCALLKILLLDSYKITILSNKPEVQFKLKIIVIIVHII